MASCRSYGYEQELCTFPMHQNMTVSERIVGPSSRHSELLQSELSRNDLIALIVKLEQYQEEHHRDAVIVHNNTATANARSRICALVGTFAIEMIVATVVNSYVDTFRHYCLLVVFQPVVSAMSGNIGLQSSSLNVQALASGTKNVNSLWEALIADIRIEFLLALFTGALTGSVAAMWNQAQSREGGMHFGLVMFFSQFMASMSAGLSGSLAPILFKRLGFNPSNVSGPLETALQDVIGSTALLAFSAWALGKHGAQQKCG